MSFTEAIVDTTLKLHYLRQAYFGKYKEDCFLVASDRALGIYAVPSGQMRIRTLLMQRRKGSKE